MNFRENSSLLCAIFDQVISKMLDLESHYYLFFILNIGCIISTLSHDEENFSIILVVMQKLRSLHHNSYAMPTQLKVIYITI